MKERYDMETVSIGRLLNKKHSNGKIVQKMCTPKAIPRPFFILETNPQQPLYARNSFKNEIF